MCHSDVAFRDAERLRKQFSGREELSSKFTLVSETTPSFTWFEVWGNSPSLLSVLCDIGGAKRRTVSTAAMAYHSSVFVAPVMVEASMGSLLHTPWFGHMLL